MPERGTKRYGGKHDGDKTIKPTFPAVYDWHTKDCDIDFHYQEVTSMDAVRGFWCNTHGQWLYEWPESVTWRWKDGSTSTRPRR